MTQIFCIIKPLMMLGWKGEDLVDAHFPNARPEVQPMFQVCNKVLYDYIEKNL